MKTKDQTSPPKARFAKGDQDWEFALFDLWIKESIFNKYCDFIRKLLAKEKETVYHSWLDNNQEILTSQHLLGYQEGQKDAMNGISPPLEQKIKGLLETARREERERALKVFEESIYDQKNGMAHIIIEEFEDNLKALTKERKPVKVPKTVKNYWNKEKKKMKQSLGKSIFGKDYLPSGFKVLKIKEIFSDMTHPSKEEEHHNTGDEVNFGRDERD